MSKSLSGSEVIPEPSLVIEALSRENSEQLFFDLTSISNQAEYTGLRVRRHRQTVFLSAPDKQSTRLPPALTITSDWEAGEQVVRVVRNALEYNETGHVITETSSVLRRTLQELETCARQRRYYKYIGGTDAYPWEATVIEWPESEILQHMAAGLHARLQRPQEEDSRQSSLRMIKIAGGWLKGLGMVAGRH